MALEACLAHYLKDKNTLVISTEVSETIIVKGKEFAQLIDEQTVQSRIRELAERITEDYHERDVLLVGVLNGAFIFAADLIRELKFDPEIQFVKYSSYSGTESTGDVKQLVGLDGLQIKGRPVLIVEDIIDTGRTLEALISDLQARGAIEIRTVALLFKPGKYQKQFPIDYAAFEISDEFVIGTGLDFDGLGRSLTGIYQATD